MNEISTTTRPQVSMLMTSEGIDLLSRIGKILAMSPLFPEHLRKGSHEQAVANGILVANMAMRLREDPLTVAQNIYFVSGKPGWSASYMIAKANQHGVFKGTISWELKGKGDALSVTAFAMLADTGQRVEATCDMEMARLEGWTKNAKYKSMPEQMLRYRSAVFLIRLYCPEVMVGVPAGIENELAMKDVTPDTMRRQEPTQPEPQVDEAETVENEPEQSDPLDIVSEQEKKAEPKPEPEKTEQEAKQQAKPEQEKTEHDPQTGEVKERTTHAPDKEQFSSIYDAIVNDLMDATNPSEVTDMYSVEIEQMEAFFPDLHAKLQAEIKAASE